MTDPDDVPFAYSALDDFTDEGPAAGGSGVLVLDGAGCLAIRFEGFDGTSALALPKKVGWAVDRQEIVRDGHALAGVGDRVRIGGQEAFVDAEAPSTCASRAAFSVYSLRRDPA